MWNSIEEQFLIDNYGKLSRKKISLYLNKSISSISCKAKRLNIRNVKDHIYKIRKYELNEEYFEKWSKDMSYFLGFIAADGCLEKNRHGNVQTLTINLHEKDFYILEKFARLLKSDRPIEKLKNTFIYRFQVSSIKLCESLVKLNIIHRKSCIMDWPENIPKDCIFSFIRGFMDGDGCIYRRTGAKKKQTSLSFVGGELFLTKLLYEINKQFSSKCNVSKVRYILAKNVWFCSLTFTKDTMNILDKIYENINNNESDLFLRRKYEIYLEAKYIQNKTGDR